MGMQRSRNPLNTLRVVTKLLEVHRTLSVRILVYTRGLKRLPQPYHSGCGLNLCHEERDHRTPFTSSLMLELWFREVWYMLGASSMPRVARRFPVTSLGFLVTVEPCYCPLTLHFAFSNILTGHMFNYAKSEGIPMCEPDLGYHGEEGPIVEPGRDCLREIMLAII